MALSSNSDHADCISDFTTSPDSIRVLSARPLQKSKQKPLMQHAKEARRRQRALRMLRERRIPSLALHCASQTNASHGYPENAYLHSQEPIGYNDMDAVQFSKDDLHVNSTPDGKALVIYDGRDSEAARLNSTNTVSACSGGDGDVSDVDSSTRPNLFELRNWRDESSISPCSSSYESPLEFSKLSSESSDEGHVNLTRSLSKCSSDGHLALGQNVLGVKLDSVSVHKKPTEDQLSAEYWKLQADVLAAECELLRVEKKLALKRLKQGVNASVSYPIEKVLNAIPELSLKKVDTAVSVVDNAPCLRSVAQHSAHKNQKKALHDASRVLHTQIFTNEASQEVDKASRRHVSKPVSLEDPREALERRLQGLLNAVQSSSFKQKNQMHASSNLFDDLGDQTDQSVKLKNRCFTKAPATRKHRDFKSLDFSKTKDAAAYIREEYRSMLCDEMFDEESYCKEAIRQIVAQVQAESEQWSQVQDIVCSLQKEMEALMETRESLEKRALRAESQLLSLKRMVHHWRYRAQNAEEELMALQSERQILKFRMQNKIERHLAEDRWHHDRAIVSERIAVPSVDNQLSMITTTEVEEQPRLANVGTQEDYALCESIGHSQNGSTRSSVDLGTASQRHSQRNIKKSLDFSNISNEGSISKSRARSYRFTDQIRRIEPARLDFCSKTSDVNSGARQRINGPQAKVQLTRLEYVEPVCMTDYKEKKMARAFALKENRSVSGPIENYISFEPALKTKFLPMAPASTPSRLPFSEIFNSPFSR